MMFPLFVWFCNYYWEWSWDEWWCETRNSIYVRFGSILMWVVILWWVRYSKIGISLPNGMFDYTGTLSLWVVKIWVAITKPKGSIKCVEGSEFSKVWRQWCIH